MFVPLQFLKKWRDKSREAAAGSLDTAVPLTDDQVRATWLCASWLVSYPDDEVFARLETIEALAGQLPTPVGDDLRTVAQQLRAADVVDLRSDYVETFDTRRRGCLYLTYFANGDTRKRGMALLQIKQAYREAGVEVSEDELPDHLSYVLEFGAAHDLHRGASVLLANRAGLELLRLHLNDTDSRWAGAVRAVCATLPALDGDDIHAVQRLAAEGPAEELVGLGGYGDGSEDMPPADMTPFASGSTGPGPSACGSTGPGAPTSGAPSGRTAFVPLSEVKGLGS